MSPRAIVFLFVLAMLAAGCTVTQAPASDVAPAPAKDALSPSETAAVQKAVAVIEGWSRDPVLVREVVAGNSKRLPSRDIATIDKAWMAGDEKERVARLLSNACANRLKALISSNPAFNEAFVMDQQGLNVCMTNRTSDFWQGDEAKWQKSFNAGKGATFVDQARYDESTRTILVQVSVPVISDNSAIGAITVGVNPRVPEIR